MEVDEVVVTDGEADNVKDGECVFLGLGVHRMYVSRSDSVYPSLGTQLPMLLTLFSLDSVRVIFFMQEHTSQSTRSVASRQSLRLAQPPPMFLIAWMMNGLHTLRGLHLRPE